MATWKWPKGSSREGAIDDLKAALAAYPQAGQAGVDLGGWTVAEDSLASSGYERIEFRSGIGNFGMLIVLIIQSAMRIQLPSLRRPCMPQIELHALGSEHVCECCTRYR